MLLFVHVPKTAGQTFVQILKSQYPGAFARVDPHAEKDRSRPELRGQLREAEQAGNRVIVGHFPFGVGRWLEGPCRYVTFLRDPVDRVVSRYYYLIDNPESPHYSVLRRSQGGLEDAIDLQGQFRNWQTRMLAGTDEDGRYDPGAPCTEETLARAKANLERCVAVGLTERFDESLVLMKLALGWSTPTYVRRNTTKTRPQLDEIPPHVLERIEEENRLDRSLYEHAVALFEDTLAQDRARVERELLRLRRMSTISPVLTMISRPARAAYRRTRRLARRLRRRLSSPA